MKKILIASAVAALSCAIPALAGGPLGGAAGVGVGANVNADVNLGNRGAASAGAAENANGNFAAERERGRNRAEGRMSEQGRSHGRASTAPNRHRQQPQDSSQVGVSGSANVSAEGGASGR